MLKSRQVTSILNFSPIIVIRLPPSDISKFIFALILVAKPITERSVTPKQYTPILQRSKSLPHFSGALSGNVFTRSNLTITVGPSVFISMPYMSISPTFGGLKKLS